MNIELLTEPWYVACLIGIALGGSAFAVAKWGHHAGPYLAITAIAFLVIGGIGMLTGCSSVSAEEEVERASQRGVNATVGSLENAVRRSVRIRLPRWPVR